MADKDPRIDAYIAKAQPFAQPILTHIRTLVHQACPDVVETWKWSFPHFVYKDGILCSMAAFKNHCTLNIWKANILSDPYNILKPVGESAMGQFGKIKSMDDLPEDKVLLEYLREAAKLNEEGVKAFNRSKPADKKELHIPDYFLEAVNMNKKARETFDGFSYSNKKDYVEWVTEAKTEATRQKRLDTTVEWLAEGKIRNWKYVKS